MRLVPFFLFLSFLLLHCAAHSQADELALARKFEAISDSFSQVPNHAQAILFRKRSLNIYQNQRPIPFERVAACFRSISVSFRKEGNFSEADFNGKRAVEVAEKHLGKNNLETARAYNSYGILLLTVGKNKEAADILQKSLEINRRLQSQGLADNLNNLGVVHENMGNYTQAIEFYRQSFQLNRQQHGLYHSNTSNNLLNIGTANMKLNRYEEAQAYFDTVLVIYSRIHKPNHPEFVGLFNNLGAIANIKGDYLTAIEYFERALRCSEANLGRNHPEVANIYSNTGILLLQRGDVSKALAFFQKTYDIRAKHFGKKNLLIARTCNYLGDCNLQRNDFDQAYEWYTRSLQIFEETQGGDPSDLVEYKNDLGFYFERLGNFQEALRYYNDALNLVRSQPSDRNIEIANSYERIGTVLLQKGSNQEATTAFQQSLAIYQELLGQKHPSVARIFSRLSLAYVYDVNCAVLYADSALFALNYDQKLSISQFGQVTSQFELIEVLEKRGQLQSELFSKTKQKSWLDAADLSYTTGIKLIDFVKNTLEEPASRQVLLDNYFRLYENAIAVKCELKKLTNNEAYWEAAFEISEKSSATLLLEALQSVHAGKFAGIPDSLLEEERRVKIDLAFFEKQIYEEQLKGAQADPKRLNQLRDWIFGLQQKSTRLRAALREKYPDYFQMRYAPDIVGVAEIQEQMLEPGQNMVGFFVGEQNIFAFVISQHTFEVVTIPEAFDLEGWVQDFRNSIYQYDPTSENVEFLRQKYANLGYELYQLVFEPIQSKLTGQEIIVLPGGVIGYLPFDALLASPAENLEDFDQFDFLLRHYQFSYSFSATLLKEMQGRHARWRKGGFLGFAPSYGGDSLNLRADDPWRAVLGSLRYNKSEVLDIQKLMGGEVFLDENATEQQFLEHAPKAGILHLALHAKSNDEHGEYSYLAFYQTLDSVENELVFVKDLYSMRLEAALVVLSACETGIGELQRGEGIVSLARGFSYAGAASIVTTLWSIDDRASSEIMENFYRNLKDGQRKDAALRNAKLNFLKTRAGTNAVHPIYWAAFIPVGDTAPLKIGTPFWIWPAAGLICIAAFMLFRNRSKKVQSFSTATS